MHFFLDKNDLRLINFEHEQAASRDPRPNPLHALRGIAHAVDLPRV
jgi:hypothetical protein